MAPIPSRPCSVPLWLRRFSFALSLPFTTVALGAPVALANGTPPANDDCSSPQAIAGQGVFSFDLSGATTGSEGQMESLCYAFVGPPIEDDVWFTWTADANGTAILGTCTSTTDTKLAVYPGSPSCPLDGTALACNDESCGVQSQVFFPVSAGTAYTVQVGVHPGASPGPVTLDVEIAPPVGPEDDCATPLVISGTGTFPFDLVGATTGSEGQNELICTFNFPSVRSDVWYAWTAPASGLFSVSTCGSTVVDTKIVVYPGPGCPTNGTAIACEDDDFQSCGFQTDLRFPAVAGATYMLQLGLGGFATYEGTGTFTISQVTPIPGDECQAPIPISGQGTFTWDDRGATTGLEGQHETLCYSFVTGTPIYNDVWYSWTADQSGTATVGFCSTGATTDMKLAVYPGNPSCPLDGTAIACDDDGCFLQAEVSFAVTAGQTFLLQIGTFWFADEGSDDFRIEIDGNGTNGTTLCFGDGSGTDCPCGNTGSPGRGCANGSTPDGALLVAIGGSSVSASTLALSVEGAVPGQPGLFFQGEQVLNGGLGVPFGDGLRCTGGNVRRLEVRFADGAGAAQTTVDLASAGGVSPGDTRRYQFWYRDPVGTPCGVGFNLSNAAEVVWFP